MVTVGLAQPLDRQDYAKQLIKFHIAYDEFFRDYFGCPKHAIDVSECHPEAGVVNYGAYLKTVKMAQQVFPK